MEILRLARRGHRRSRHRPDRQGAGPGRGHQGQADLRRGPHREGQGRLLQGGRPGGARQGPEAGRGDPRHPRDPRRPPSRLGPGDRRRARATGEAVMPAKASRAAFGEALLDLGARDERIVTLDADLSKSTMTAKFAKTYPSRAFNVGIAESGMIGLAAGLALSGRVPFACSFACFLVGRFETIRVSVAYTNAPVKLVGTHVGVAIGEDGYTQMGLEDIACIRSLPNIPIIQPADEIETKQAVAYAVEHAGPLYLRLTRQNLEPVHDERYRFQFGKADLLRPGTDVTVLATGGPLFNALEAATKLGAEGVNAEILNIATIKPLDEEAIDRSAGKTGRVVTVEDHSIHGGLGSAVAELLSEGMPTPLHPRALTPLPQSAHPKPPYAKHGLDPDGIARAVLKFLNR